MTRMPRSCSSRDRLGRGAVRVGDDGRVDLAELVDVERVEDERHAVVRVQVVQAPARVRCAR